MSNRTFSQDVLAQLRADGYRPAAWGAMFAHSWRQARSTARAHPDLVREWRWLASGLGAGTVGVIAYTAHRHGKRTARRLALPYAVMTLLQVGDLYVHLGLHHAPNRQIHASLGLANYLTALRQWIGAGVVCRLLVQTPLTDAELCGTLAMIVGTDLVDGPLARRQDLASPLGRYLDGEADIISWTALTVMQTRRGQVPGWFLVIYGLRWLVPTVLGFGRTFATAEPIVLQPSRLSRLSGAGQVALALSGILATCRSQQDDAPSWRKVHAGLLVGTSVLLVGATIRLIARLARG
jgi:phosphatidylglycerophosphate synthase